MVANVVAAKPRLMCATSGSGGNESRMCECEAVVVVVAVAATYTTTAAAAGCNEGANAADGKKGANHGRVHNGRISSAAHHAAMTEPRPRVLGFLRVEQASSQQSPRSCREFH